MMEAVMRTYYVFQSESSPGLRGFTDDATGEKLPPEDGPWSLLQKVEPDEEWTFDDPRAVVATGINENGFYLSGPVRRPASTKPIIESDRVEGTAVFDPSGNQIGTIKRLLIEKVSGRVVYVDVTFGGFLGLGVHHATIPWEKLTLQPGIQRLPHRHHRRTGEGRSSLLRRRSNLAGPQARDGGAGLLAKPPPPSLSSQD
jgi:hypothetical protein